MVRVVDDRLDTEEIVQHGFGSAIGAFHPGMVVGIGFSDDEDVSVGAIDQLRGLADLLVHVTDIIVRGITAGMATRSGLVKTRGASYSNKRVASRAANRVRLLTPSRRQRIAKWSFTV
jgi:hypothetical protein